MNHLNFMDCFNVNEFNFIAMSTRATTPVTMTLVVKTRAVKDRCSCMGREG